MFYMSCPIQYKFFFIFILVLYYLSPSIHSPFLLLHLHFLLTSYIFACNMTDGTAFGRVDFAILVRFIVFGN